MEFFYSGTTRVLPDLLDGVIIGVYLIIIFLFTRNKQIKNIDQNPAYRYYFTGMLAKIVGVLTMCLIYIFYYNMEGDIFGYYHSAIAMSNMAVKDFGVFLKLMMGDNSPETWSHFDHRTGAPWHRNDYSYFTTVRLITPFVILGFRGFLTANILIAWFSFKGTWKLYMLFCELYPKLHREFAFAILFFPSLLFWGSGMLKDTFTLAASGLFAYSFYYIFIKRQNFAINFFWLVFSSYIILFVKPYIFVALAPGALIWLSFSNLNKIKNPVLRFSFTPLVLIVFILLATAIIRIFSAQLGQYGDIDSIIRKAQITQDDMMRAEAYSENYFDIGKLDGTFGNFLAKIPAAVNAALFRPYFWEARNPLMFISAAENTLFLIIALLILWRVGIVNAIRIISEEPLLIFSIFFSLIFGFAVGVSTANFGALARLRIPLIPFFAASLFILQHLSLEWKNLKKGRNLTTK